GDMHLNSYRKLTPEQAPPGFEGEGAYAALSDDMGKTWRVRKLTGGNVRDKDGKPVRVHTVSYVTARQGPDGIIHLVTSHNHPDLHFELNEAWILQDPADAAPPAGRDDTRTVSGAVKKYSETYPNGQVKVTWGAGVDQEGRYVLHGTETWYYENGQKQWQAEYSAGRRVGAETYWARDGKRQWKKMVNYDGTYHWTVWRPDGKVRGKSTWEASDPQNQ
ncbi:MAG: toxin-antitoxin system YwqK family antitoxin, partial [Planctomycetota bacterium]